MGRDVTNPIGAKGFHDVHYLRQMLFCVFKSLHHAQRKLAFHHADLRLANIMELMPPKDDLSQVSAAAATGSARIQDTSSHDASFASQGQLDLPAQPAQMPLAESATQPYLQAYQPTPGPHQTAPEAAGTQQPDASRVLQPTVSLQQKSMLSDTIEPNELPHMQEKSGNGGRKNSNKSFDTPFKIIDFGLADFRETFGAGYVTGRRGKLIHNEPHHLEPLRSNAAQVFPLSQYQTASPACCTFQVPKVPSFCLLILLTLHLDCTSMDVHSALIQVFSSILSGLSVQSQVEHDMCSATAHFVSTILQGNQQRPGHGTQTCLPSDTCICCRSI